MYQWTVFFSETGEDNGHGRGSGFRSEKMARSPGAFAETRRAHAAFGEDGFSGKISGIVSVEWPRRPTS